MRKSRLCAITFLCLMVISLAVPVETRAEPADSQLSPLVQLSIEDTAPVTESRVAGNSAVIAASPEISDEAWLLLSAMLAFAGLFIIHKLA